jgi:hypothetical protein
MTLNEAYNLVNYIVRIKNKGKSLTPEKFEDLYNRRQVDYFQELYINYESTTFSSDSLRTFKNILTQNDITILQNSYFELSDGLEYNWSQDGTSGSIGALTFFDMCDMTSTDVAVIDSGTKDVRAYRFDGSTWASQGSAFSIGGSAGVPAIARLSATDVVYIDQTNGLLKTIRFNGSSWVGVGNTLNLAGIGFPTMTSLNSTDIALIGTSADQLQAYRFDGNNWTTLGNAFSISGNDLSSMAALNSTDIVFANAGTEDIVVYRFDGTNWSLLTGTLDIGTVNKPRVAALTSTDFAYVDDTNDELKTYRYENSEFVQVGNTFTLPTAGTQAIARMANDSIAYVDLTNLDLTKYDFTSTDVTTKYFHFSTMSYVDSDGKYYPFDFVTKSQAIMRKASNLTLPTTTHPICYEFNNSLYLEPYDNTLDINFVYLRYPLPVILDYYIDTNGVYNYLEAGEGHNWSDGDTDSAGDTHTAASASVSGYEYTSLTTESEWNEDDQYKIVEYILRDVGISMSEGDVYKYADENKNES